jgi:hypothetical protein
MRQYKINEAQIGMIRWILDKKNKNESGIPREKHILDILEAVESRPTKEKTKCQIE